MTLFDDLVGCRVMAAYSVLVEERDGVFVLDHSVVLETAGGAFFQILVEDARKTLRKMSTRHDVEVWGEFHPTNVQTTAADYSFLPFQVTGVSVAVAGSCFGLWEGPGDARGDEYVLGAVLWNSEGRGYAVRTDAEELHLESSEDFVDYLNEWWAEDVNWTHRGNVRLPFPTRGRD